MPANPRPPYHLNDRLGLLYERADITEWQTNKREEERERHNHAT